MIEKVIKKLDNLTKPKNSLGDLERLVVQIADIQNTEKPCIDKKAVVVMCADNGVVEEGVSRRRRKLHMT